MQGSPQLCDKDAQSYFSLIDTELEFWEVWYFACVTQRLTESTQVFCSNLGRFALLEAGTQVLRMVLWNF